MISRETLKCVTMLDVLDQLSKDECKADGMEFPGGGCSYTRPDGSEPIHPVLWEIICEDQYGNQQFSNDCFYRFTTVSEYAIDNDYYTERQQECLTKLREMCINDINSEGCENEYLLFKVSW